MSLSSIKELYQKIKNPEGNQGNSAENSENNNTNATAGESNLPKSNEFKFSFNKPRKSLSPENYRMLADYMVQKFQETREIFFKFNAEDYYSFIEESNFVEYGEKDLIFEKNTPCDSYLFILHGDIDFFDSKEENSVLIKTISAGKVYGHLVKENYKYYIKARSNISLISIKKKDFDDLITNINKMKNVNKFKFIKKFFPKIRVYSDDIINNVLQYFERVKFNKHSKIFLKDEYNEYVYLIIKGQVAFCARPKTLFHMDKIDKDKINDDLIAEVNLNILNNDYIIIDKFSRGDVFGINTALKGQKSFCTVVTLTENVEVYRIVKGNLLFYFGGSSGILPVSLKALGDLQDESCQLKIEYFKSIDFSKKEIQNLLKEKFTLMFDGKEKLSKNKKIKKNENYFIIDENSIKNTLFEAWKSFENLGSKISDFKAKLLGGNKPKKKNIFGEAIEEKKDNASKGEKDFAQITGDATNRVVSRRLNMGLNTNQLRSLDKLNMFCGVKKSGEDNIKKVANITSKLEGGGRSKLMSFMRNDDGLSTLEGFSKMANEKDKKKKEEEAQKAENEKKEEAKKEEEKKEEEKKEEVKKEEEIKKDEEKKEENDIQKQNNNDNKNEKEENKVVNNENKNENIEEKKEVEKKEEIKIESADKIENVDNKKENEENNKENNEDKKEIIENKKENEDKDKVNKPKRVRSGLKKLRGLDL